MKLENEIEIEQVERMEGHLEEFSELLKHVVDGGASIGFLRPLDLSVSKSYWENVLTPDVILFAAKINHRIVGTAQLHLCTKENGKHRAEVAKVMTHPSYQKKGIGRALMQMVEQRAKQEGRSLLILDTREGDPSNHLYTSLGFIRAGRIPGYVKSENGELEATILYYKEL